MEKLLNDVYNNPSSSAYLAGLNTVYRVAKKKNAAVKMEQVRKFLQKQDTYTLHKPIKHRFPRNRVIPAGLDSDWQMDLVDMKAIKKHNKGHTFILTCIDVLSRYAWAVPVKNKQPATILAAFKEILKDGRKPWNIMVDSGTEFKSVFKEYMKDKGINLFTATSPDVKAGNVERYNRTLKTRLWRHFTKNRTFLYLDVLPQLVSSINRTVSRATGHRPVDVTPANAQKILSDVYRKQPAAKVKFNYNVGDRVRITKEKSKLHKGYLPNFTQEVFIIKERLHRTPATYRVVDQNEQLITGIFYEPELTKVARVPAKRRRRRR